ncbi:hypothetical protein E0485_14010 [Paenibacillus albiflavus]|uniref:Uncharacterized protein n=1 Tax=Paenibacillus albiflavus TaxID=2545760 RepID=A0A4R4EB17_9BACL|nr:hypothetical protein [Paenibacillus albiflavus]TCZ76313.1 hypothetical protein E0485_14010 [Paenibacillus albiflavus]
MTKARFLIILSTIISMLMITSTVSAAKIEVSNTTKSALTKMIESADTKLAKTITTNFDDLMSIQKDNEKWDDLTRKLNSNNNEDLSTVKKQIKLINADKITKLQAQVDQAKTKLQPLTTLGKALKEQLTAANKQKDKSLAALIQMQIDSVQITTQIVKADISVKEKSLKSTKEETAKKVQSIRDTIAGIDPIKAQIKTKKTAISDLNKQVGEKWSSFLQVVKKGTPQATSDSLASLVSLDRTMNNHKQAIHQSEKQINTIIMKAKSQIP